MIRLIYWFLSMVEALLFLAVVILFLITDSRTITLFAEKPLHLLGFTYTHVQGNFLLGFKIQELSFQDHLLFDEVTLHWNPVSLFYNKLTITQLDAQGVELDNILLLVDQLNQKNEQETETLNINFSFNNIHLDINPYVYEGVTFSSVVLEMKKVEVDQQLNMNMDGLYFHVNSNLMDVKLKGKIRNNNLLVSTLNLKKISIEDIRAFSDRINKKSKKRSTATLTKTKKEPFIPFKTIKINKIRATLKAVNYGDFQIKKVLLLLEKAEVYPSKNYAYDVKKLIFKGETNFGELDYNGFIHNSIIEAQGEIFLDEYLFRHYSLPLNFRNLRRLPSRLKLTDKGAWIDIEHEVENLLESNGDFIIDVKEAKHQLYYDYKSLQLTVDSELYTSLPYAHNVHIVNRTIVDEQGDTSYKGRATFNGLTKKIPSEIEFLLDELEADFEGDMYDVVVHLNSSLLQGTFTTQEYETAMLLLETKYRGISLEKIVKDLPLKYASVPLHIKSKTYLDFKHVERGSSHVDIASNLLNLSLDMEHDTAPNMIFSTSVPYNSPLTEIDKNLNVTKLANLNGTLRAYGENYELLLSNNDLEVELFYKSKEQNIERGVITLGQQRISFNGNPSKLLYIKSSIYNLQTFFSDLNQYYTIDPPPIEGAVTIDIIKNANKTDITLKSKVLHYIEYKRGEKITTDIEDVQLDITIDKNSNIELKDYTFRIFNNNYIDTFYSTKSSYFYFNNSTLEIKKLWLNDEIVLKGFYNIAESYGQIKIDAENFGFKNRDFDLLVNLDLNLKISGKLKDLTGNIHILGNNITYEVIGSGIVEDPDIIIVDDLENEEESALKNLKMYVKIDNKNPLYYYGKDINIELYNQLSVVKNYGSDMMVTGMSTITKGYYEMEDKRFILDESHVYFTGDISKPLLDIKANYEKDEYLVHIFISGSTESPIVNFNSDPYLTQQEILSLILFDGTGSGGGAEAYTLLGGTFAKGLMKSLGISVDHLLLGTDENDEISFEIGRKVSDNISVLYMHRDGKDGVKVRVEHSRNFETDIIIQPPNTSSIEFLYKQDR